MGFLCTLFHIVKNECYIFWISFTIENLIGSVDRYVPLCKLSNLYIKCLQILLLLIHVLHCYNYVSVGWEVEWGPVSGIKNPLARKSPFHWISMKSRLVRAAREISTYQNWSLLTNFCHITWLKYCRYDVNTIQSINQFNY